MFAATNLQHVAEQPVEYDASASNTNTTNSNNTKSVSWTHTASGTNRMVIVVVGVLAVSGNYTTVARTVTYGGFQMMSLGAVHSGGSDNNPWVEYWYLPNPPTGSQTVNVTVTKSGVVFYRLFGGSYSYTNCNGVTGFTTGSGTTAGTALSQTVSSQTAERVLQTFESYNGLGSGSITSYNQTQITSLAAAGSGADDALLIGDAAGASSISYTATAIASAKPYAQLAVRLLPVFSPFSVSNTTTSSQLVPNGTAGCYVTLIGGGGGGGVGYAAGASNRGGGGGGGGGSKVTRTWVPRASLGSTFSVTVGAGGASATNGGDSIFTSGSVTMTAGGGGAGGAGTSTTVGAAGAAGTASVSGVSATTYSGSAGGAGGAVSSSPAAGSGGSSNANGAGAGGGGGSGLNSSGTTWTTATGSTGGDSDTAGGAARPANTNNAGYPGTNGTNGDGGGGGGGAGIGTSFAANIGGAGGTYGGGGGGSSATNGTAKAGGAGAAGWTLIEWV